MPSAPDGSFRLHRHYVCNVAISFMRPEHVAMGARYIQREERPRTVQQHWRTRSRRRTNAIATATDKSIVVDIEYMRTFPFVHDRRSL